MKCVHCGFESCFTTCEACEKATLQAKAAGEFAVAIYQGHHIRKGQAPAGYQLWSKFVEAHRGHYTEEQWQQVGAVLRSGKDWAMMGVPGTPAMVLSPLVEGTAGSRYLADALSGRPTGAVNVTHH